MAHLVGVRQYADALTKDESQDLILSLLYEAELDFRSPKQRWERICWGREQLEWEEPLKKLLFHQPQRLKLLLQKGALTGGALR